MRSNFAARIACIGSRAIRDLLPWSLAALAQTETATPKQSASDVFLERHKSSIATLMPTIEPDQIRKIRGQDRLSFREQVEASCPPSAFGEGAGQEPLAAPGVCGVVAAAADGAGTHPDAQSGGVCRSDGLCPVAYRRSGFGGLSGAGPRLSQDKKYPEAVTSLHKSATAGQSLSDYADYLAAQANLQSGNLPAAELLLNGFATRHPDSIFVPSIPVLEANLFIQEGDPQTALAKLKPHLGEPIAAHADFQLAQAQAEQMAGQTDAAAKLFRHVFLTFPLSNEAQSAKTQLAVIGAAAPISAEERRTHADALYRAGRFNDAAEEYRALANDPPESSPEVRNAVLVAAANCDWKLKRLNKQELDRLPDTQDEAGARRMYLLMELARDKDDGDAQREIVEQMKTRFGESPWLAEALYSSGNMYLLRKDYAHAIDYYGELAKRFPKSCEPEPTAHCSNYSPSSHWRAAWLNYRLKQYSDAARLMDEQIANYPGGKEIPGALYWRGRIYEQQERRRRWRRLITTPSSASISITTTPPSRGSGWPRSAT